jgi:hypothetical protein
LRFFCDLWITYIIPYGIRDQKKTREGLKKSVPPEIKRVSIDSGNERNLYESH